MWLGRGIESPLAQGWYRGFETGVALAWRVRAHGQRLVGPTGAAMRVSVRLADVESIARRGIPARDHQRRPFLHEVAVPYSALARGPPDRGRKHPYFQEWICEICCIDKEK